MKTIIIDDEDRARSLLRNILEQKCEGIEEIHEAGSLIEGVQLIKDKHPKLVFLDIEMPNQQGTEIFDYFEKDEINFEIVFSTAYSEYAMTAFDMNAIAYLLKPLRPKRVAEVVEKVKTSFDKEKIQTRLEELQKALRSNEFKKIGLPVQDGILFMELDKIIHLEADSMYTKVYTAEEGEMIVSKPLRFFENLLDKNGTFYRPHRSHIINLKYLKQYVRKDGTYILLENDQTIPISKDKKDEFLELISSI